MAFSLLLLTSLFYGLGHGVNNQPVIGIFMQSMSHKLHGDTSLSANYVKFIEQAGARVVPIKMREPLSYYQNIFGQINGILYPAGHTGTVNSDYFKAGKIMYNMVVKANDNGDFFPLFGIAEGHQMLVYLSTHHRFKNSSPHSGVNLPLVFEPHFRQSRMMKDMPQKMVDDLKNQSITPNFQHFSISVPTYQESASIKDFYRVISTNTDDHGRDFISTMEARKSKHQFHSDKELGDNLIEKFHVVNWDRSFQQKYYINYTTSAAHAILG